METQQAESDKLATIREIATIFDTHDFPIWDEDTLQKLPSNRQWAALADPHLITVRIAAVILNKPKSELLEMIAKLEKDEFDGKPMIEDLVPRFHETEGFFKALLDTVEGAETRLLAAACKKAVMDGVEGLDEI